MFVTLVHGLCYGMKVREWAEAERSAVEAWCTEQRQAAAREKRAVLKQARCHADSYWSHFFVPLNSKRSKQASWQLVGHTAGIFY